MGCRASRSRIDIYSSGMNHLMTQEDHKNPEFHKNQMPKNLSIALNLKLFSATNSSSFCQKNKIRKE